MIHYLKTKTPFSLINKIKSNLQWPLSSLFFLYIFSSATENFRFILYVLDLICQRFLIFSALLYCWNIDPTNKEPSFNNVLGYFNKIVVKLASMRSSTKFEIVLCNNDFSAILEHGCFDELLKWPPLKLIQTYAILNYEF